MSEIRIRLSAAAVILRDDGNTRKGSGKATYSQVRGIGQKPGIKDVVGMACADN